jgi:hypothetical protein
VSGHEAAAPSRLARARDPVTNHPLTPTAREVFSDEQIDMFLDLIRTGVGRALAAQRIGSTGSFMRALCRKERDPEFAALYDAAVEEGKAWYEDRLRAEARQRALGGSDRMLEVELATHSDDYRHLRRDRMNVNGKLEVEHALVLHLDPAVLDTWERDRIVAFRAMLEELQGGVIDAQARELPVGGAESDSEAA